MLRNHGCAGNVIDLYVLARNGTDGLEEASNELKVDLNDELNKKKMLTDFVCIRNGTIINTDVSIDIVLDKFYKKFESEIRENVNTKTTNFFALNNWEYGQALRDVDLIKTLSEIKEINSFDVAFVTADTDNSGSTVIADYYEIIRPDNITISFVYN